jgi:hypothetical protein
MSFVKSASPPNGVRSRHVRCTAFPDTVRQDRFVAVQVSVSPTRLGARSAFRSMSRSILEGDLVRWYLGP